MKPKGKSSYCNRKEQTSQQKLLPGFSASFGCSLQSYCCGWYQSQVSVRHREREREFKYMYMLRGKLLYNPHRERDGERERAKGGGGSRGRESRRQRWWERGIAREQARRRALPQKPRKAHFVHPHPPTPSHLPHWCDLCLLSSVSYKFSSCKCYSILFYLYNFLI